VSPFRQRSEEAVLFSATGTNIKIKKGDLFRVLAISGDATQVDLVSIDMACLSTKEKYQLMQEDRKHD